MAQLIVVFGLVECVFGWLQLLGFAASGNSMYPATGTFYNPGPYCGFLAVIVPVALHAVLHDRHKAAVRLSGTYLVLAIGLMPALMGRTGWIAALLGCAVVAAGRYVSADSSFKKGRLRIYAVSVIVLTAAFLALLYFLKPDSAQGRVLMWMVAFKAMIAHPWGVGWDRVAGAFGQAQEDYFAQHPDSVFISVAGAPEYVFNEFLQIGIAFGIAGFIAFIAVVAAGGVTAWRSRCYGLCGAVVAFAAVCFSSYPLQFTEFYLLIFLLGGAIIFHRRKYSLWLRAGACVVLGGLLSVPAYGIMERKRQTREWDRMSNAIRYRLSDGMMEECDSLVREMGWSARCLFDYGKALRGNGDYEKSNEVLRMGVKISSDPMFLNLIGRNHEDMGETAEAVENYTRSKHRLPNRLYPYYLLAMLYAKEDDASSGKFRKAYREAIGLPVKVESPATREMREALEEVISKKGEVRSDMNGIIVKIITAATVVFAMVGGGCSSDKGNGRDAVSTKKMEKLSSSSEGGMPVVKTMKLTEREITHDMVSNGKIMARETADLYFRSSEPVSELWVREGQRVKRGQKLARLDLFKLESERAKLLSEREKAFLDMQDVLIGQGYDPADKASVPEEVMRLARVRSGFDGIETSIALNKKEIEQSTLTAPFDGVVADLKIKRFGIAPTSEPACRIINDGGMQVEFPVLESELSLLHIGDGVEVSPFAGGNACRGKVTEINPKVDEKGLVKVRASLSSVGGMIDGMNARVRVSKNLGKRLVVPKSAVVLRSGREVVFTLENGKAMWNYVTTGIENLDSREILEGLTAGQTVITDGNENLAHQTPVVVN